MKSLPKGVSWSLAGAAAAFSLALAPTAFGQTVEGGDRFHATTLSLSAYGETQAAPDMASLHVGVTSDGTTAAAAMAANAAQMSRVIAALKAAGVAAKDIQTSGLNLNPQYVYAQNQPPRLTGYQASDQVSVRVRDLPRLGTLVDATVGAGATQINGVSFGLADPTAAQDAARQDAVHSLAARAELYAKATGYRVVRLVSLSEGAAPVIQPPQPMVFTAAKRMAVPTTPVEAGELDVRLQVNAVYELAR